MKHNFRNELFNKIRSEMQASTGKQRDIAASLGITQKDVSVIKLGRIETFSTDKLIDIADKCGWSFKFSMVEGDSTLIKNAISKEKEAFDAHMDRVFGGGE